MSTHTTYGRANDDASQASLSIRRYQAAVGFMAYENTVFWTRAGFFLVAETALLGFIGSNLPEYGAEYVSVQAVGALVLSIVGLVMSRLWWLALRRGEFWILERKRVVDQLEEAALGELQMIRGEDPELLGPRRGGAKAVAYHLVRLFFTVWFLLALYTSAVLVNALVEGKPAANPSVERSAGAAAHLEQRYAKEPI